VCDWRFIEAVDVLFFRDGRSFEAGDDHGVQSLFPPRGRTVWGAVRGALLSASGVSADEYRNTDWGNAAALEKVKDAVHLMGKPDDLGPLNQLVGPFIARKLSGSSTEVFLPLPADLLQWSHAGYKGHAFLRPLAADTEQLFSWGTGLPPGLRPLWVRQPGLLDSLESGTYLKLDFLAAYLEGDREKLSNEWLGAAAVKFDPRVGLGLEGPGEKKMARQGLLYSIGFAQPRIKSDETVGLLVGLEVDSTRVPADKLPALLQLGGEKRWASMSKATGITMPPPPQLGRCPDGKTRFRVYLATDAVLGTGWAPSWLQPDLTGTHPSGLNAKLVSVAISGKVGVGGFDLAAGGPGRSRGRCAAVPAGSVYFFETDEEPAKVLTLHGKPFGDKMDGDDQKLGLGLGFIGGWEYV